MGDFMSKGFATAAAIAALMLAGAASPGPAMGDVEDEVVPESVLLTRLSLLLETQDTAQDQSGTPGPLKNFLVRDTILREEIEGSITRNVTRYDLRTTYGISDKWNVSLNISFVEVEQVSTLGGAPGASAEALELVDLLQTQTISGIGDVELTSLHRPVFSDWNAFTWGYGLVYPGSRQQSPYVGTTSLQLGEPMVQLLGFAHYTRYPALPRSRVDLRVAARHALNEAVTVANGESGRVDATNSLSFKLGWSQELGNFIYGLGLEFMGRGEHTVGGERLVDQVRAQIIRTKIGYGNLSGLDQSSLSFPYQVRLEHRNVLRGADIPDGDHLTLSFLFYF